MAFSDGIADFRSDTVTRPTDAMLKAMADAPLGDDVYHDDPTVNALEEESAAVTGKEAGIYTPTGTMGNQLSVMLHTNPGEEILANEGSHVRSIEAGAPQALSGVGFRTVKGEGGRIEPEDVEEAMAMAGFRIGIDEGPTTGIFPPIGLMVWENTHNMSGGRVIPVDLMEKTTRVARSHSLAVHIDGARIFNAVAATGVAAERYAAVGDTIQFCFSKGLGAPVGSIVCGSQDMIDEIRFLRKRLGGGMRQAGVIAAAARVALADRDRLVEDHVLARSLGDAMAERFPGSVDPASVETNMVRVDFASMGMEWEDVKQRLDSAGIKANPPLGDFAWRLVTHRDVDAGDAARLLDALS